MHRVRSECKIRPHATASRSRWRSSNLESSNGARACAKQQAGVRHLMQERLKDISSLGDSNDASCPGVVHAVMEVINATSIHNLLPGDVGAGQVTDAISELRHCSVVLSTAKEAHVGIGQVLWHRQSLAVRPHKGTCTTGFCQSDQKDKSAQVYKLV